MNSVFVTGCNRGLGLGLVKSFLALPSPPKQVFATVRDLGRAQELQELAERNENLRILQIDVTNFNAFPELVQQVEENCPNGLSLLINNAGFSPKFTRLAYVKAEDMQKTFLINVVSPVMMAKALRPLLKRGAEESGKPSWIVNMSSILGSIAANKDGGLYPYKASKAALNACTKSMSIDLLADNISTISLHPGWVKTDMGGKNAPLTIEKSCQDIVKLVTRLTPEENGKFLQHDGKELPW